MFLLDISVPFTSPVWFTVYTSHLLRFFFLLLNFNSKPTVLICLCPTVLTPISDWCILSISGIVLVFTGNPQSILNSMRLNTTMHFGLRGRQEHVQMLWGDIELITDDSGVQYLEFHERTTKTRQGVSRDIRAFAPKMHSTGN
jgi:hypothetical protein